MVDRCVEDREHSTTHSGMNATRDRRTQLDLGRPNLPLKHLKAQLQESPERRRFCGAMSQLQIPSSPSELLEGCPKAGLTDLGFSGLGWFGVWGFNLAALAAMEKLFRTWEAESVHSFASKWNHEFRLGVSG